MASVFTPVSAVSGGKKNLKLKVRVAHIWNITDKEKPDEITCMNLLLIDEKVCVLSQISFRPKPFKNSCNHLGSLFTF